MILRLFDFILMLIIFWNILAWLWFDYDVNMMWYDVIWMWYDVANSHLIHFILFVYSCSNHVRIMFNIFEYFSIFFRCAQYVLNPDWIQVSQHYHKGITTVSHGHQISFNILSIYLHTFCIILLYFFTIYGITWAQRFSKVNAVLSPVLRLVSPLAGQSFCHPFAGQSFGWSVNHGQE